MNDSSLLSRRGKVLVWDLPVRVFHWLLAASFAGAWLTAERERWRLLHVTLGCTVLALVVLRIVWGLFGTLLAGCDRAARLTDQLLTLARVESAQAPDMAVVDLASVVRGVMAELAPAALAKGQQFELDAPEPCAVRGNALLLAVLARNLVDNAVRYGPRGAPVCVLVRREGIETVLGVEDGGPGLDDVELARLGERFYRPVGNQAPGSGLGWSIVRRIAAVHGARVDVRRSARWGGLAVSVRFAAGHPS